MAWSDVWDFVTGQTGETYANLAKTGVAALSTYASFKDQQKKNEMQQAAYDDYMAQADAAGHAARAAIDINYTPMTVSGVPTTKADVTDFTAVAAHGGLMNLPTRQRKRYARGPNEFEVETMDEEVITPYDLQMEEGVNIGEQVKYNTGRPRHDAWNVWNSGGIDQEIYEFDFEIFFDSGDWMDILKGQGDVEENMQMASAPNIEDSQNDMAMNMFGKPYHLLNQQEIDALNEYNSGLMASGGIAGLRHGGRTGYADAGDVRKDPEEVAKTIGGEYQDRGIGSVWPYSLMEDYRAEDAGAEMIEEIQDYKYGKSYPGETEWRKDKNKNIGGYRSYPKSDRDPMSMEDTIAELEKRWDEEIEDGMEPGSGRDGFSFFDDLGIWKKKHIRRRIELGWEEAKGPVTDTGTMKVAQGGRIGYQGGGDLAHRLSELIKKVNAGTITPQEEHEMEQLEIMLDYGPGEKDGGRIKKDNGGIMNLGGLEKDYRTTGGFVPIGGRERADDVPARLSKNEFVMTADAVRAAGGGSINKGAQRMYDTMKHLEASPQAKRMTA